MKKNRLLSLLLVLVMVLGMLPGPALAVEAQEDYATLEQLEAAFEEVGETDDVDAALAALDAYLAVYDRLSDEDKEANAEALAMAQAYRETLVAGKEAEENEEEYEDPEIDLLYDTYTSKVTLYPSGATPTGVKMSVGSTWDGNWVVTAISTSSVTFGCKGQHNNGFLIPAPADIWEGVTHSYNTVCAGSAFSNKPSVGSHGQVLYSGGSATYSNLTPSGGSSNLWNFTLKYDANGGSGAPSDDTWGTNDKYTKSHSFTVSSVEPTRANYTFKGWASTKTGEVSYTGGSNCSVSQTVSGYNGGSVTKTLYAVWQENAEKVTLTYYDRGTVYATDEYNKGANATIRSSANSRPNYTLLGWDTDPSADEVKWEKGDTLTINSNMTLYAVWKYEPPATTADYTVNWYDTDGNPLKAPETRKGTVDETVSATGADKSIAGYIYLEDRSTPSAELAASGTTLTLVFAKKITVTWLKEDGTQIKQIEIPNGDDSYKSEYPSDPSTTGKWGAPKTDADGNITIRWEESTKPEIVTKTVRIFKYFVGPTVEQVQAIKDNFSITYTYVLNGQTETKTLYGRDVALSTEFHDGAYDDDAYLGLPVLYWDVQLKMNKDSTPQDESDAGMISFTESGKEVTGWTWYDFDEAEGWENETGFSQAQPIYDGHISIGLGNYYKGSKEITIQKLFNGEGLTAENLPGDFALNLTQYVNGATNKTLSANTAEKITVDGKPGYQWKVSADVLAAYDWTYCYVEEENTTINGYTLTGTSGWEAEDWNDGIDHHYFMVTPAGDQVFTIINSYKKDTVTPEPEKVTVTFKDGYDNTEIPDSKITDWTKGEEVPEDRYPTVPVHEDKDFDGWEVETDGDGNITITAKWKDKTVNPGPDPEPEPEEPTPTYYTVIYTDGVAGEEIFPDQVNRWLTWNEATPAFNGTPERDGWTFLGWSPAVADRVRGSVTYVAQWQENEPVVTPEPTETPAETGEGEDLEENDTPLTEEPELPGKNEGDPESSEEGEDLEDADTPLAEVPAEEAEELEGNDVPLADVPQTGDSLWLWVLMALCSAAGLATLLPRKKGKREA